MKRYITLFCLLMAFVAGQAADHTNEAVWEKVSEYVDFHADGSQTYRCSSRLRLLTHRSFNSMYGETFIIYNPQWQKVTINENYTQQADGTIIKAPANALNPSLPFSAVNAPYYNQLRELVVSHTGLEIGATIILDYTIETKPGFAATQEFLHRFNDPSPIDDYTLTVSAPGELTWHGGMINGKEIAASKSADGKWTWHTTQMPGVAPEVNVDQQALPYVYVSVSSDDSRATAVAQLIEQAAASEDGNLADIIKNDSDKADESWTNKHVNTCTVPLGVANEVRKPAEVATSAYGTVAEKAALTTALLQQRGKKASIICAYDKSLPPGMASLSHIYVRTGDQVINAENGASTELAQLVDKMQLWENGRSLTIEPQAHKVSRTVNIDAATDKKYCKSAGNYTVATIPADGLVDNWHLILPVERTEAMSLPELVEERDSFIISLPTGASLQTKPYSKTVSNGYGTVTIALKDQGGKALLMRTIRVTKTHIPVSGYPDVRALLQLWQAPVYRTVAIKK